MPTLASGLRISSQQLGPDETIPQTHRGPHGPSMIRSVKRAIVNMSEIHPTFALCSFTDVRDGFARDCPHRHPVARVLALRARLRAVCRVFSGMSGDFSRRESRAGWANRAQDQGTAWGRVILSRARFSGPGRQSIRSTFPTWFVGRHYQPYPREATMPIPGLEYRSITGSFAWRPRTFHHSKYVASVRLSRPRRNMRASASET